jgi:hypothetical protein
MKYIRKEVRIPPNRAREIKALSDQHNYDTEQELYREIIDIGYYVKKKQLEESIEETDVENWDQVYQEAAINSLKSQSVINKLYQVLFNPKLSKYECAEDELDAINDKISQHVKDIINGNDNPNLENIKGGKSVDSIPKGIVD